MTDLSAFVPGLPIVSSPWGRISGDVFPLIWPPSILPRASSGSLTRKVCLCYLLPKDCPTPL